MQTNNMITEFANEIPGYLQGIYEFDNSTPVSERVLTILDYMAFTTDYDNINPDVDYSMALNLVLGIIPELAFDSYLSTKFYTPMLQSEELLEDIEAQTLALYQEEDYENPFDVLKRITSSNPSLVYVHLLNVIYDVTFLNNPFYTVEMIEEYVDGLNEMVTQWRKESKSHVMPEVLLRFVQNDIIPNIRVLEEVLYG